MKHLYFVCPTDHLETVINDTFKQENYFFTSLGNSITFDTDMVEQINGLIETKNITEITFVLSDNNRIVMDALTNRNFSDLERLNNFYSELVKQKERSKVLWQMGDLQVPILIYYLDMKIKELQSKISSWIVDRIKINGKIYNREKNVFKKVHSDFFCGNYFSLN